ncbi:MAG: hypothetical protein M3N56_01380 [Actinomycetota bacterium]|nr:hypothetical protein [Actinomycetota bacterium]
MARRAALAVVLVALAGCGSDDDSAATPEASTPAPLPSVEPTATATPTPRPTATVDPEDQPGGAGDEEEARVRARFRVTPKGISPAQVSVPAFLAIELVVDSYLAEPFVVRLEGAPPLSVGAGRTARLDVEGRRPGRYTIDFGGAGQALLITGAEPGP